MARINKNLTERIDKLQKEYLNKFDNNQAIINIINEVELPEGVYNSNAIENSTLTLEDTEKILLDMEINKNISTRELHEAQNLAKVMKYVEKKCKESDVSIEIMNFLHKMLLFNIREDVAGRLRKDKEWVKVGKHIGEDPQKVEESLNRTINEYKLSGLHSIIKIAKFHVDFEIIHPYIDGNGRIGRVLINYFLLRNNYPPITIQNKEKQKYYATFRDNKGEIYLAKIIGNLLCESLHKRLAYMNHRNIMTLAEYAKSDFNKEQETLSSLINKARRQTISAFREKGVWKIGI